MNTFDRTMGDMILTTFLKLSDDKNNNDGKPTEMSGWVKDKLESFASQPYSDCELYDFLAEIANIPVVKMGSVCVGHISSFMQVSSDVKKFYEKPNEGEKKVLDRSYCEQILKGGE